jgi:hypothetical protein
MTTRQKGAVEVQFLAVPNNVIGARSPSSESLSDNVSFDNQTSKGLYERCSRMCLMRNSLMSIDQIQRKFDSFV